MAVGVAAARSRWAAECHSLVVTVAGHCETEVRGLLRAQPSSTRRAGLRPVTSPARPVPHAAVSGPPRRRCAVVRARSVGPHDQGSRRRAVHARSRRAAGASERHADVRHPLRDEVEPVRHDVDGRTRPRPVRTGRRAAVGDARDRARRVRLHDERPARRHHHRRRDRRLRARRRTARTDPRWTGARRHPPPLLLEERQVGARARARGRRPSRVLGTERLPHVRRSVPRAALHG